MTIDEAKRDILAKARHKGHAMGQFHLQQGQYRSKCGACPHGVAVPKNDPKARWGSAVFAFCPRITEI